jgi:hypothetical protein
MKCDIDTESETLHTIKTTSGKATLVKESTSDDMTRKNVEKNIATGEYEVSTTEPASTDIRNSKRFLFGYVGDDSCNDYCEPVCIDAKCDECVGSSCPPDPCVGDNCPTKRDNCKKKYKPGEIGEITRYCNSNYLTDINNYESPEECILKCTKDACPDNCRNENEIDNYCQNQANLNKAGFKNQNDCMNVCLCKSEGDYLYRSVSNLDPFPQSKVSPYYKGTRKIGKNWYGYSEYITDDSKDESAVTGDNSNRKVEYIIDLSPEDIKSIREDNKNDGAAGYTNYIYSSQYDKTVKSSYKSKFIHDDHKELFKKGIKTNGTYIEAQGDIE